MRTESEITRGPQLGGYEIDASPLADGSSGMHARRREDMMAYARYKLEVLGSIGGTVLEIGAGYGANFGYLAADGLPSASSATT